MSFKGGKTSNVYESEEGYDLWADFYDDKEAFLDSFEEEWIYRFLGDIKGKSLLDIGCGTGRTVRKALVLGAKVSGVDVSEKMLEKARGNFPRAEFVKCDAEKLAFEDESFDIVTATFFIVHLKELERAFDEVYRVLKPGGVFLLSNINQKKAPKLKISTRKEIVIQSFYHRPEDVLAALEHSFFKVEKEEFVRDRGTWINQIIKAIK